MNTKTKVEENESSVIAEVGKANTIKKYEVFEHELGILEQGPHDNFLLGLAVFCLSTFINSIVPICCMDGLTKQAFIVYVILAAGSAVGASICFPQSFKNKGPFKTTVEEVKKRIKTPKYKKGKNSITKITTE